MLVRALGIGYHLQFVGVYVEEEPCVGKEGIMIAK
jgi:hypothetical protein